MTATPNPSDNVPAAHLPAEATGSAPGRGTLTGRRLLIVGGGQQTYQQPDPPIGIGRAISVLAGREGAALAIADIDLNAAQHTVEQIHQTDATAHALQVDGADETNVVAMVSAAVKHLDGLDGVVMNLGVAGGHTLAETTPADWDRVMAINVRSHFLGCKHALPQLAPGAAIVLISSTAARLPSSTDIPAYSTSKAALSGLCAYVAREAAARRVRTNIVMAGLIDTSLGRLATLVKPDRADTPIPLGRQGTAWDVAHATTFLLSDAASYITGQTLVVDGGLTGVP